MEQQPSYEECKEAVLQKYRWNIEWRETLKEKLVSKKNGKLTDMEKMIVDDFKVTPHELKNEIKKYKRQIEFVIKDKDVEKVKKTYALNCENLTKYYNGVFYERVKGMSEIFRNHEYPLDVLTSYDDFEEFYNTHPCYPKDSDEVRLEMMRFWEENPNGIVEFG